MVKKLPECNIPMMQSLSGMLLSLLTCEVTFGAAESISLTSMNSSRSSSCYLWSGAWECFLWGTLTALSLSLLGVFLVHHSLNHHGCECMKSTKVRLKLLSASESNQQSAALAVRPHGPQRHDSLPSSLPQRVHLSFTPWQSTWTYGIQTW